MVSLSQVPSSKGLISQLVVSLTSCFETFHIGENSIHKLQHIVSNISNMRCSVSSGDETLCRMFDISSQTKSFLKEKLRMQILSSVSSDFQTLIKH